MNLKELVINYSKYEQAYKKNDNIKEILKRYNKFEIYNVIESIFHLFASFAFTFFIFHLLSELANTIGVYFLFLPVWILVAGCFFWGSCEFFNFIRFKKEKNINQITKLYFADKLYQNHKKFIKFNNKINKIPKTEQKNIIKIRKTIFNILEYKKNNFNKRYPKEKSNYNQEEYENDYAFYKKKIKMFDILLHFLKQESITEIRKINIEIQNLIKDFDVFKQKELLDIIDQKIKEEENSNKNELKIQKENTSILEKLNNKNNRAIKEI